MDCLTARMIKALETTENRDKVFGGEADDSKSINFHGVMRQVQRTKDVDEVYESLKRNWLIKILGTHMSALQDDERSSDNDR